MHYHSASLADAVLDHPSISDLHAAVCYEGLTSAWRVVDIGSAHGTFIDNHAVGKVQPFAAGRISFRITL